MTKRNSHEPYQWNSKIHNATGEAFDWKCPICEVDVLNGPKHMGHVAPFDQGVGVVPGNIVFMCPRCNSSVSSVHLLDYIEFHLGKAKSEEVAAKLDALHSQYFDATRVRMVNAGARTKRMTIYMTADDRQAIEQLTTILKTKGNTEILDSRGKPSMAALIRMLVMRELEKETGEPQ